MVRQRDEISESDEHNARGIELADRGWFDEASSEFKKAIKLDPLSAHAHDNLATILAEQGNYLGALQGFLEALRVDPESPTVHHYLASFLAAHGPDLAIKQYRQAIELEDDFPDAHLNLALALADQGQIEEAVVELEIAHAQAPDDDMIEHELAACLIDVERYPDAIGHLKHLTKAHPENVEAHVDLGIAYTAQGFYAEAESTFKKSLEIDGLDFAAHYHLAALYVTWDRHDEAVYHLQIAMQQDADKTRDWLHDDRIFEALREHEQYASMVQEAD
jgi:tetratricopeptide (TPR) repeat protein